MSDNGRRVVSINGFTSGSSARRAYAEHAHLASRSLPAITSFSNTISASHNIAISINAPELALLDTRTAAVVRQWPVNSLVTHLVSSHTLLLSGSADGTIRTHDVRHKGRIDASESYIKAHLRGVQGLEVSGNLVFSIGWGERFVMHNVLLRFCLMHITGSPGHFLNLLLRCMTCEASSPYLRLPSPPGLDSSTRCLEGVRVSSSHPIRGSLT